jgi:hypothetical protein
MTDRQMPLRSTLLAAVLVAALVAGCSSGDDTAAKATTTTVDAAAAKTELATHLLTADDLASGDALDVGWLSGDVAQGVDIKLPDCVLEAPGAPALATVEAKLVTDSDLHLPSIEEDLASYAAGDAAKAFAAAAARLDGCKPTFVYQGEPAEGQIARLPLTLGGSESAAWRTTVTIAGAPVAITSIHVRRDNIEMSLIHVDLGSPDAATIEGIAAKAIAKLP